MSLGTLTTRNLEATPFNRNALPTAGASETSEQPAVQSSIEVLTAYIPSEVIGLYVAGVGILQPTGVGKWFLFGLALLMIPLVIWLTLQIKLRQQPLFKIELSANNFLLITVLAIVAFTAWSAALPSTPFQTFSTNATQYGGFAVLVLAVVLPLIGRAFGLQESTVGAN